MRLHSTKPVRHGVTLVEVLVAIFVMALGLMALLTLFPLGALNMAQAIKDDRAGTAAHNAASIARIAWHQGMQANAYVPDPDLVVAMIDPDADPGRVLPSRLGQDGWSYPVFVDAIGWTQYPGQPPYVGGPRPAPLPVPKPWRYWMAGERGIGLPRATLSPIRMAPVLQQIGLTISGFTFRDDMTFDENGVGQDREGLYSWAYVLQMSSCVPPFNNVADMKVVVYRRRAEQLTENASFQAGEALYAANFGHDSANNLNPKIVTLTYNPGVQEYPSVRRGGWIADVTLRDPTNPADMTWKPRAYFYRVVNIADINANTLELELQTEVKGVTPLGAAGTCAVLENVVEVFDKGGLQ